MGDILQVGGGQWLLLHPDLPALNMALVTEVEPFTESDDVAVYTVGKTSPTIYKGDQARRIRLWLAKHGDLPILGPPQGRDT